MRANGWEWRDAEGSSVIYARMRFILLRSRAINVPFNFWSLAEIPAYCSGSTLPVERSGDVAGLESAGTGMSAQRGDFGGP